MGDNGGKRFRAGHVLFIHAEAASGSGLITFCQHALNQNSCWQELTPEDTGDAPRAAFHKQGSGEKVLSAFGMWTVFWYGALSRSV